MSYQAALVHPLITDYFTSLYDAQKTTKRARRTDMRAICRTWTQCHGTMLDPAALTDAQARAIINDLVEEQGRGAVVVDRIIQTGRSCWAWLIAEEQASSNPFAAIPLRDARTRRRCKAMAQGSRIVLSLLWEQLRYAAPPQYHTLNVVLRLLQAGVRPAEITALQANDIDPAAGRITVRSASGIARRTLPLSAEALAAIDAYRVAVKPPITPGQPLIGQQRGGRWRGLSVDTLRRRFHTLRDQTAAQLRCVIAMEEHNALALTALQGAADLVSEIELDQLRS